MILTIIVFILILGILIFAHEMGHFVAAKKAGVRVDEFGFGFPPRIFGIKKGETTYSLNLFPVGGFVRIYGEDATEKRTKSKRAFYNKPIWQRVIITSMGVIMNLFLAAILLSIVFGIGVPSLVEQGQEANYKNVQIQILETAKQSPAEEAGIKAGDAISTLYFEDKAVTVKELEDVQKFIAMHTGEEITVEIKRGKEIFQKNLIPRVSYPKDEGAMGIAMAKIGTISYPWYQAILKGFETTGKLFITIITLFYLLIKSLILEGKMIGEIAGPVGIFSLTSQMVKLGLVYILQFTAIFSITLAIINIIPIPALDGGRLLFLAIEKIRGKPLKPKTEQLANSIGFAIIILLMIVITFRDIIKLF